MVVMFSREKTLTPSSFSRYSTAPCSSTLSTSPSFSCLSTAMMNPTMVWSPRSFSFSMLSTFVAPVVMVSSTTRIFCPGLK